MLCVLLYVLSCVTYLYGVIISLLQRSDCIVIKQCTLLLLLLLLFKPWEKIPEGG